jgi:hypothetical protein
MLGKARVALLTSESGLSLNGQGREELTEEKGGNVPKKARKMVRKMARRSPSQRREAARRERRPRCWKFLDVQHSFVGLILRTQTLVVDGHGKKLCKWQD